MVCGLLLPGGMHGSSTEKYARKMTRCELTRLCMRRVAKRLRNIRVHGLECQLLHLVHGIPVHLGCHLINVLLISMPG